MKILNTRVLRGPNYWSNFRQKLIVLKLDLQEYDDITTDLMPGFYEKLIKLIPSLYEHHCSLGVEGGFLQRVKEGTLLGHVVEHVALELQYIAGMKCTFGRVRATQKNGVYHVVFAYEIENAGLYAATAAVDIVRSLAGKKNYYNLEEDLQKLKDILAEEGLGPSTKAIVNEAQSRGIPYHQIFSDSLVMFGHGSNQKKICAALTSNTSAIAVDLVSAKELTKKMLSSYHIPVPKGVIIKRMEQLNEAINEIGYPLVIKPSNGNHGRGVSTNINTKSQAEAAYKEAKKISSQIIIEQYVPGHDFRFLVINHQLVAVAKRKPASVIGDGVSSIAELVEEVNRDPKRGKDHDNFLTNITIDKGSLSLLDKENLTLNSVLPKGKEIYVKCTSNISTGGTSEDVTDEVHPYNKYIAERIAHIMQLDICGIDIMSHDIRIPLNENNGVVIEVNAAPGLRMHLAPTSGKERNVAKHIVDLLYPHNSNGRIPITAVTGTNGKTTTVRLLAHFAKQAGFSVGYTTTDGIYVNNTRIFKGDCSGPISAKNILREPTVNYAILECARGGIIESGLGFDKCDISIVTNVSEDHLGLGDVETIEELARVKSVVPVSTAKEGYAILNADDNLVFEMKKDLTCNVALFSMENHNPRIEEHCSKGGLASYLDSETLIIRKGAEKKIVSNVSDIPLTFNGKAKFMIQNILPAILAGVINNYELHNIDAWLKSFIPSAKHTPGRMNLFDFDHFKVLLDYGHNVAAILELKKYLQEINCNFKIGIIGAPGDRRNTDIEKLGYHFAQIFDEIIIRHDKNGRGRTNNEITSLIKGGIMQHNPLHDVKIISDEQQAIEYALSKVQANSLIAYFPEDIHTAIEYLEKMRNSSLKQGASYET